LYFVIEVINTKTPNARLGVFNTRKDY